MAAIVLDGKALAAKCKEEVKKEAASLARTPGLAVIIVGNNPASRVYVNSKRKDCEECGFYSEEYTLLASTTQEELLELIRKAGQERNKTAKIQLNWPQAVVRVTYQNPEEQESVLVEEANISEYCEESEEGGENYDKS